MRYTLGIVGYQINKPDNLKWIIYSIIFGCLASIFMLFSIVYLGNRYLDGNLLDIWLWIKISVLLAGLVVCGLISSFYIWKDKSTRQNTENQQSLPTIFLFAAITAFEYPQYHLVKRAISDGSPDNTSSSDSDESGMSGGAKVALVLILLSGFGGPGIMAFTALIVGIFWLASLGTGQKSPTAEKLNPDGHSIGRTLIHKMLGGKGKK